MPFHKMESSANFVFGSPEAAQLKVTDWGSDDIPIRAPDGPGGPRATPRWTPQPSRSH